MNRENIPLCWRDANSGLSLFFATLCIVDIFGVFPIIALPRSIVQCASGSLFAVTACLAVWKYGDNTTANILEAMPSGSVADIAVLLAALQLCFSSVIGYSALFQHLEDQCWILPAFGWKRCAMRSAVVLLSVAVGESVSRFDIVMALIGGSLTGSLVFVLPPFDDLDEETNSYSSEFVDCYKNEEEKKNIVQIPMISTHREDQPLLIDAAEPTTSRTTKSTGDLQQEVAKMTANKNKLWTLERMINYLGYFIITIGIAITLSSTYVNIWNTIRYVRFTPPCIINATANRASAS